MSASSNRGAVATRASGTTDSAMRANPSRVGRRVAEAFAASATLFSPNHRANAGCHERLASARIPMLLSVRARALECVGTTRPSTRHDDNDALVRSDHK